MRISDWSSDVCSSDLDFGIARPATADTLAEAPRPRRKAHTLTPGYAAPERVAGAPATTLSDIYSLGKLLEMLTAGDRPDPERDAIVARAAANDPAARYATVGELRADVTAWRKIGRAHV